MLAFQIATSKPTIITAVKVGLLVGLMLNLINQGEAVFSGQLEKLDIFKLVLTFAVPYLVSTYSVTRAKLDFAVGDTAAASTRVQCHNCGNSRQQLKKGQRIPVCKNCIEKTDWQPTNHEH